MSADADLPTTEDIRGSYAWLDGYPYEGEMSPRLEAEFDGWLTEHDRVVAARAWDQGRIFGLMQGGEFIPVDAPDENPYRTTPHLALGDSDKAQ